MWVAKQPSELYVLNIFKLATVMTIYKDEIKHILSIWYEY
jgi:hypothetical protein